MVSAPTALIVMPSRGESCGVALLGGSIRGVASLQLDFYLIPSSTIAVYPLVRQNTQVIWNKDHPETLVICSLVIYFWLRKGIFEI